MPVEPEGAAAGEPPPRRSKMSSPPAQRIARRPPMTAQNPKDVTDAEIRETASETVRQGVDIRTRVHDLTLSRCRAAASTATGCATCCARVTAGMATGAERSHADMRQALAEALKRHGPGARAVRGSGRRGAEAARRRPARSFSDTELKQALANLKQARGRFRRHGEPRRRGDQRAACSPSCARPWATRARPAPRPASSSRSP